MARSPSEDEAAAIAAAIERFRAETAPAPGEAEAIGPWQRAALVEGSLKESARRALSRIQKEEQDGRREDHRVGGKLQNVHR
jgi:hypothetical protein